MLWQTIQSRKLRKLQVVTLVPFSHPASPPHTAPQGAEPPVSGSSLSSCCGTNRQSWETWGNSFRHKAKSQMMLMKKNRPGFLSTYFLTFSIKIIWKYKYINFKAVCVCVCVCTGRVLSSLLSVWMWAEVQPSLASSWNPAGWTVAAEEDSSRDWWTSAEASDWPRTAPVNTQTNTQWHIISGQSTDWIQETLDLELCFSAWGWYHKY